MDDLGERLLHARKSAHERRKCSDRKLTQEDVARAAGISREALSLLERGISKRMRNADIFALSEYLEVDPEWLLTGKGNIDGNAEAKNDDKDEGEDEGADEGAASKNIKESPDWWQENVPTIHALTGQIMKSHKDNLPTASLLMLLIAQCKELISRK